MNGNTWDLFMKLGVPAGIAVFLVYYMATNFEARMTTLEHQHVEMNTHSARVEDLAGRALIVNDQILMVLRAQCVNAAKTKDERTACLNGKLPMREGEVP